MLLLKLTLAITLIIPLFGGCSNDEKENENPDTREEVVFAGSIGITENVKPFTRDAFKGTKDLKLIVRDNNNPSKFLVTGDKTIKATTGTATDGKNALTCDPVLYWDDLGGISASLKLLGIYPYTANPVSDIVTWNLETDQSSYFTETDQTKYPTEKELMFAQHGNYLFSHRKENVANLNFEHVLTKITVLVNVNKEFNATELAAANVNFINIPLKGDYDITDNSCTFKNGDSSYDVSPTVKPCTTINYDAVETTKITSYSHTILCAPHNYTKNNLLATIVAKGNTYNVKLDNDDLKFEKGKHTVITVNLTAAGVTATASLTDWGTVNVSAIDSRIITFEEFEIKDISGEKKVLTEGSIIRMAFTDKRAGTPNPHNAVFEYKSGKWVATTPIYWDDIDTAITKVEALLIIKPASGDPIGEHYFSGSLTKEFTKAAAILGNSQINLDLDENDKFKKFFSHPLSKVDITITTNTETGATNNIIINNIKTGSVFIKGKVKYKTNDEGTAITQKIDEEDLDITNKSNTDNTGVHVCLTAYIWPQDLKELCHVTVDGNTYKVQANNGSNYTFEPGKHYTFTVKITKTEVSATASLTDWDTVVVPEIGAGL